MPLDRNDSRVTGWPSRWGCTRYSPLVAGARSALEASGLCKERHYPSIQCTGGGILGTIAPLTGAVRAAKQWTTSGPKLSLASTDMLQELGHLAGQKAGCVWEGDNRPGWHPACLPRYRKAMETPPCSYSLCPGFRGPGEHPASEATAWAFPATPDMGPREGLGSYFGSAKRAVVGVEEAMTGLARLGPLLLAPFYPCHPPLPVVSPRVAQHT